MSIRTETHALENTAHGVQIGEIAANGNLDIYTSIILTPAEAVAMARWIVANEDSILEDDDRAALDEYDAHVDEMAAQYQDRADLVMKF